MDTPEDDAREPSKGGAWSDAVDWAAMGEPRPLAAMLLDPRRPPTTGALSLIAGLILTLRPRTSERDDRIRDRYRSLRARGLTADDALDEIAAEAGLPSDSIHNIVRRKNAADSAASIPGRTRHRASE
jgi:hypothetical protein